jgi:hypothetical protein
MDVLLKKLGIKKSKLVNKDFDLICDKYRKGKEVRLQW